MTDLKKRFGFDNDRIVEQFNRGTGVANPNLPGYLAEPPRSRGNAAVLCFEASRNALLNWEDVWLSPP
ncbi:MAG: hypothetical protein ACTHM6_10500, partial [Tepidisphaeraceae bacterium]